MRPIFVMLSTTSRAAASLETSLTATSAFFGEGEGDRAPDAAGPSGDEGGPTFEFHARFLPQASGQGPP